MPDPTWRDQLQPATWPQADHWELGWNDAPELYMWAGDQRLRYPLRPDETHELCRRLVGYLALLHRQVVNDPVAVQRRWGDGEEQR